MATYYINSYNTSGVYPYINGDDGAPNFYTLLDDLSGIMKDGDDIVIVPSTINIDDSANTININYRLDIIGDKTTRILLPDSGVGLNINMDGVTIDNIWAYSDTYNDNILISVNSNNVTITNSLLGGLDTSGTTSIINVQAGGYEPACRT